jgi:undecaprenyl-diphosphatase
LIGKGKISGDVGEMNEWLVTAILGVIEGVTEFLPISSTAHLLLFQKFFGYSRPELFDVGIQAGAVLAVVFIYWQKLLDLARRWREADCQDFLMKCGAAFLVTCVLGLLSRKLGFKLDEDHVLSIAIATLVGAGFIFWAERKFAHEAKSSVRDTMINISWMAAIIIGVAQVLAGVFPGTSRSGATIIAAMLCGLSRVAATEFSFILGIPTMFAATGYLLVKQLKHHDPMPAAQWMHLGLGFVISMIVAFLVVKWLLKFVRSHSLEPFAWYRVVLGIGLLIWIARG